MRQMADRHSATIRMRDTASRRGTFERRFDVREFGGRDGLKKLNR